VSAGLAAGDNRSYGRAMDFSDEERDLILAGLFELTLAYLDDLDKIEKCSALAARLGGDQEALFFGAAL
jgi:hypothetical protein